MLRGSCAGVFNRLPGIPKLIVNGSEYGLEAHPLIIRAASTKKENAAKIGGGTAVGAIIGAIAGGGAGSAYVPATRGG